MKDKLAAFLICLFAVIPNDQFRIPFLANTELWFYLILVSGFLGFLFLFSKGHILIKIALIYLFINCFLSKAPYLSFTAYTLLVATSGFYLLCLEITNYNFIIKAIQSVFFLNIVLIVMQSLGFDKLMNFGQSANQLTYWGSVGNPMILGSFIVCLMPILVIGNKHNIWPVVLVVWISRSYGSMLSILSGLFIYLKGRKKLFIIAVVIISLFVARVKIFNHYMGGRWPAWKKTVFLTTTQHPFFGYGIGTYKVIFPVLSQDVAGGVTSKWKYQGTEGNWLAWRQAHNCFLQILFETGYIGFGLFIAFIGCLLHKVRKNRALLSGLIVLLITMIWSFPTRMIQSVLVLILFFSICEKVKEISNDKSV
jgi:hypothetical protein